MWKISVEFFVCIFGKYYKITNVDQGKYYQINVGHTKFQPTLNKQNNVVILVAYPKKHPNFHCTTNLQNIKGHPNNNKMDFDASIP